MTDEKYTLAQTNRERKRTASGARHKINGARSRKVTLPSDNLTPAQIKKLSGPVITYNMDLPHTIKELRCWPKDLQRQYMQKLIDRYHPTNKALAEMLGYGSVTPVIQYVRHELGLSNEKQPTKDDRQDFIDFLLGVKDEEESTEDTTDPEPANPGPDPTDPDPEPTPAPRVTRPDLSLTLTYRATTLAELVRNLVMDPLLQSFTEPLDITLMMHR
jgi:hypothetical protein